MSAKWSIIKALTCFLLVYSSTGYAQEVKTINTEPAQVFRDTIIIVKHDTIWIEKETTQIDSADISKKRSSRYDKRVHRYRKHWESLIPTHTKLQFAGNMGLLSLGTGWDYGKRNQWETDILFGILPKYDSKRTKITMTLKQNYMPWSISLGKDFAVEPLACGMYFNTVFGGEFWTHEPDRYPKGYYGFSSKVRIHAFLGQRLTYKHTSTLALGSKSHYFLLRNKYMRLVYSKCIP